MTSSSTSDLSLRERALLCASLGMLLLCGLVGWSGAGTPGSAHGAEQSFLHSQERQLEWAESFANLFARQAHRKDGALTEPGADAGTDGTAVSVACALADIIYYPVTGHTVAPPSQDFPHQSLYLLPAPRGPPSKA